MILPVDRLDRLDRTVASAVVVVWIAAAAPVPQRPTHAKVDLLSESSALTPGQDATLGVRFAIDDGWHIYWRNPGESGGPPSVKWTAPNDMTLGELQWPVPERIVAPGDTTYGYLRNVMLLATAHVSPTASLAAPLTIRAVVDYQICKDVCIRESATASITLPVGASPPPTDGIEFTRARASLPAPMPSTWIATATLAQDELVVTVDTGRSEPAASFLPFQPGVIDDGAAQRTEAQPRGLAIHLKKSPLFSIAPPSLDGLLILTGNGAFEIRAPLR
jgi:DsbC/DsbD-like thiol-disulfide interchange protein